MPMTWYDTNLNPIEPPSNDNNTYIFIQKPHVRTLKFAYYVRTPKFAYYIDELRKRFELPWFVFVYKNKKMYVVISKEMPTLDSELYSTYFPNLYADGICMENISYYYDMDKITPQDYIDYFWQSCFICFDQHNIDRIYHYIHSLNYEPFHKPNLNELIEIF